MPELPEVEILTRFLQGRTSGCRVQRAELASFAALKTFDPPLDALVERPVQGWRRRGKHLCLAADGLWLVIHLARGGWVRWYDQVPEARARPSKATLALRVGLVAENDPQHRPGFDLTEAGTEKRLALWVVRDPSEVASVASLGVDPLDPGFSTAQLKRALAQASGNLKSALTTQSRLAGVGNAYSDEALHAARLSPFKSARSLSPPEIEGLRTALLTVLTEALRSAEGLAPDQLKGDKKLSMRVHGRTGQPCPVCGDQVRQVSFATKSLQYCASCQTEGKPLKDRRLSRLLK